MFRIDRDILFLLSYIKKILNLPVNTFQIATNSVLCICNATLSVFCVLKMISSGSLISVNPRLAVMCNPGVCIFAEVLGLVCEFSVCGGRVREIAKRFAAMESPRQALLGRGAAANLLQKLKKTALSEDRTAGLYWALSLIKCLMRYTATPTGIAKMTIFIIR